MVTKNILHQQFFLLKIRQRRSSVRRFSSLVILYCIAFGFFRNDLPAAEDTSKDFVLDNGLRVFLLEKRNCPLFNVVAAVNLGVINETAETSGIVHVIEHSILFRGTELRSGDQIGRDVRSHGGYFNAHTGEDLAFFEISVPVEHAEFALLNQREILFHPKITQEGLDAEIAVILEEFRQLEDDPIRYATALAYQRLFSGHPYSNPLLGNKDVIQNLTAEKTMEFYQRHIVPANCSLAVVGDLSLRDMEEKVRQIFGELKATSYEKPKYGPALPLEKEVDLEVEMDVRKAYLVIAAQAPDYNHPDQYAIDVLTEVFGRGVDPMLFTALSQRRRLAETITMAYQAHRYGGAVLVYLTLDPKDLSMAKRETLNFLRRAREARFGPEDFFGQEQMFVFDFLEGAKNQIRYRAYESQEKGLAVAVSLAQHMLLSEGAPSRNYLDNIDKLKSPDLRKAAAKYFSRAHYVLISIIPKKTR
jgi:predicted Zn-dependent peptidase